MELASYDQYEKMFGAGPMSSSMAMQNDELARMFQQDKLRAQQATTEKAALDTMFQKDTYGSRVQGKQFETEKAGWEASDAGVKGRINQQTEGLQLDAAQKEQVLKASKADLDQFELGAQQMAYSQDPKERAEGIRLMQMHKDFVKLRETQNFAAGESEKQRRAQAALEAQRQAGQIKLETLRGANRIAAKGAAAKGIQSVYAALQAGKTTPDKAAVAFGAAALEAQAAGDMEAYAEYSAAAARMEQLALTVRPDAQVGKPDVGAIANIPVNPPRAPAFPAGGQQPTPVDKPPVNKLSDVQKMYPGVPPEKLREAYKKKFGVDLQ